MIQHGSGPRSAIALACGLAALALVALALVLTTPVPVGPPGEGSGSGAPTADGDRAAVPLSVGSPSAPSESAEAPAGQSPVTPPVPLSAATASATEDGTLPPPGTAPAPPVVSQQDPREELLRQIQEVHELTDEQTAAVRRILQGSRYIGQGNPAVTRHPATVAECRARLDDLGVDHGNPTFERICGRKYMAPLYDPATESIEDAAACIDQFEFPDIPCAYPVVWVRAREAAQICRAMGKRLCDAHEWEGACAGSLQPPDYRFDLAEGAPMSSAVNRMRAAHNAVEDGRKTWAYGDEYRTGVCAAASRKTEGCDGGGWNACGSNTYPTGMFPECRSELGVYDQHGNAAEHMNLPLDESQMASRGSEELGVTEMKGSWFIFDSFKAHEDSCRWRAPFWHGTRVMDPDSHHNYHLGFRCCADVGPGG